MLVTGSLCSPHGYQRLADGTLGHPVDEHLRRHEAASLIALERRCGRQG